MFTSSIERGVLMVWWSQASALASASLTRRVACSLGIVLIQITHCNRRSIQAMLRINGELVV